MEQFVSPFKLDLGFAVKIDTCGDTRDGIGAVEVLVTPHAALNGCRYGSTRSNRRHEWSCHLEVDKNGIPM